MGIEVFTTRVSSKLHRLALYRYLKIQTIVYQNIKIACNDILSIAK
jgi:hypothetical protein